MSKPKQHEVLGLDIGGVIIDRGRGSGRDQTFWSDAYLETSEVEGAIDGVAALVKAWGARRVYLVSRSGPRSGYRTRRWLEKKDFYARTGMLRKNVHFCRERWMKAIVCDRLGVTYFVDDRKEVLEYLHDLTRRYYFRRGTKRIRPSKNPLLRGVRRVRTWRDLVACLT